MKDNIQRHVMVLIFAAIYALVALLAACFMYADNKDSITQLTQRVEVVEHRQYEPKNNPCVFCHMSNEGIINTPKGWGRHGGRR